MKILLGILFIVVAAFLSCVESGTPLGTGFPSRPGAAPRPVQVPASSGRRQTGRGGRPGRSGRRPQPAVTPEASSSTPNPNRILSVNEETIATDTYIQDPQGVFIKISENMNVVLFQFRRIIIGRIEGENILPIFNKDQKIIRIDNNQNGLMIPMSNTEARRWGVFAKYAAFVKNPPAIFF